MTSGPPGALRADCSRCFGLCCVVPAFVASADFALTKPAGHACPHLQDDSRCGIHSELRPRGFPGCTVYDCFGAGQQVSQVTFAGQNWRTSPELAAAMFAAFPVMRGLHELLWYLHEAVALPVPADLRGRVATALAVTERLTGSGPQDLAAIDLDQHHRGVNALLLDASDGVRRAVRRSPASRRGADLIGADLRGSDLRSADLSGALFLTQLQVNAATGDASTVIPLSVVRPPHWTTGPVEVRISVRRPPDSRPGGRRPARTPASPRRPSSGPRT